MKQNKIKSKILIIEDNEGLSKIISKTLNRAGFDTDISTCGMDAVSMAITTKPWLMLLDYMLPDIPGSDVIKKINAKGVYIPFVAMTGHGNEKVAISFLKLGAKDYLIKDTGFLDLLPAVVKNVEERLAIEKRLFIAETKKRESEERYRALVNATEDIIMVSKYEEGFFGKIIDANIAACSLLEYAKKELLCLKGSDIYYNIDREQVIYIKETLAKKSNILFETIYKTATGKEIPVEIRAHTMDLNGESVIMCIARDITKRIKIEKERYQLATAVEQAEVCILIIKKDLTVEYINPAYEKKLGYKLSDTLGKPFILFQDSELSIQKFNTILKKTTENGEWSDKVKIKNSFGKILVFNITASLIKDRSGIFTHLMFLGRDITRELELEDQLRQAQKLEALGTLAGGIAHDFNNILSAILGNTELASIKCDKNSPVQYNLEQIIKAVARSKNLVQQIMTFSRKKDAGFKSVSIYLIIKEAIKFIKSTFPSSIKIKDDIKQAYNVFANATQLHQVVMNLCTNAAHSIKSGNGILEISLSNCEIHTKDLYKYQELKHGSYVKLIVKDNGSGIDNKIIDKIFDPYFTTKTTGEGTGLGLSVTHGIIKKYKGAISVQSTLGSGSVFTILFPAAKSKKKEVDYIKEDVLKGYEHILFVDDEKLLVELGVLMLEDLGYNVVATDSSIEALKLFEKNPDKFDIVITDLTMPDLNGFELAKKILTIKKKIPIILCTGYHETMDKKEISKAGIKSLLVKPIKRTVFAQTVRKLLDEKHIQQSIIKH